MKKRIRHRINKNHFRVAIFGSARVKSHDPVYKLIFQLAQLLAKENIDIVTGGGPGLMEAASKGHVEGRQGNHSHSIGLTIKLPKEQRDAVCLDIKKNYNKFSGRLDMFMQLSNVVVVAPGGIGTLLEFLYTWQLMQVKHICDTPIILLGPMWKGFIDWVKRDPLAKGLLDQRDFRFIFQAKDCREALKLIRETKNYFENGGKNICLNLVKYR